MQPDVGALCRARIQPGRAASVSVAGCPCPYIMALQVDEVSAGGSIRSRTRVPNLFQRWLESPRLPVMLALGAVLVIKRRRAGRHES